MVNMLFSILERLGGKGKRCLSTLDGELTKKHHSGSIGFQPVSVPTRHHWKEIRPVRNKTNKGLNFKSPVKKKTKIQFIVNDLFSWDKFT